LHAVSLLLQDTDGDGVVPEQQQLVLQFQGPPDNGVATADEPPVVLGRWAAVGAMKKLHTASTARALTIRSFTYVYPTVLPGARAKLHARSSALHTLSMHASLQDSARIPGNCARLLTHVHYLPPAAHRLPQEFVQQMGPKLLRAGRLLRFSIRSGGLLFNTDGSPAGADLAYEGPANQRRGRADIYSKVLFQWQARRQPVQLNALLAAATAGQLEQGETQQQPNSSMADD
jgi:hypothetical protein